MPSKKKPKAITSQGLMRSPSHRMRDIGALSTRTLAVFEPTMNHASRFAPIVYHTKKPDDEEVNWPVNVYWFMQRTSLWFYAEGGCNVLLMKGSQIPDDRVPRNERGQVLQPDSSTRLEGYMTGLGVRYAQIPCGNLRTKYRDFFNAADRTKKVTYYLRTFGAQGRGGIGPIPDPNPALPREQQWRTPEWITYVHMYANADGGATIQYWRVYAYQDYKPVDPPRLSGKHGGDWEGMQVVLDSSGVPKEVRLLGHGDPLSPSIKRIRRPGAWDPNGTWDDSLKWRDGHPIVASERGGHATEVFSDWGHRSQYVEQQTWTPKGGGLQDMGSFSDPKARWVRYSGLWGSPPEIKIGDSQPALRDDPDSNSGGWWGPAFNGNEEKENTVLGDVKGVFLTSWCEGMRDSGKTPQECFLKKPQLIGSFPDN
ncbi:MAG TPA: hypothetical protein VF762_20955 [Blastocatellia bacterium]|jgi:hypothetical protein